MEISLFAIRHSLFAASRTNNKRNSAMRILVVGAGAIGGYFGGRMLQAGRDVTFLVRPRRAAELADAGLVIKSPNGDVTLKHPPALQADKLSEKFDVVLLSCKAFDLDDAIKSFASAVGPRTSIIPLLNGMLHLDVLDCNGLSCTTSRLSLSVAADCRTGSALLQKPWRAAISA